MMDQQILCSDRSEVIAVEVSDAFGESRCEGLEQEISSRSDAIISERSPRPRRLPAWKTFPGSTFSPLMMKSLISLDIKDETRSEITEPLFRRLRRDSNSNTRSSAFSSISTSESRSTLKCSTSSASKPGKAHADVGRSGVPLG